MSEIEFHTFGCKVNTYDTGLLQDRMRAFAGVGSTLLDRPVHIINSCAVTAEATREGLRRARTIKKANAQAVVVLTGCAAQVDGKIVDAYADVDLVVANSHKTQIASIIESYLLGQSSEKVFRSNIFRKEDLEPGGGIEAEHTRAFLKVQDGCNSFCSYCVIPYARGKSRSLSEADILSRVSALVESGVHEIVVTGIHLGDYECPETRLDFVGLVSSILEKTTLPRLRLSSLEPLEVSRELLMLYKNPRLCPHLHMSIQSATTSVLRDMKRNYTAEDVETSLTQIRDLVPAAFVGMDVIVGFPTETREMFEETYMRLTRLPWTKLHVFPYSERTGTKAATFTETVDVRERKIRSSQLRELSQSRLLSEMQAQLGQLKQVLVLKRPARGAVGLSRDFYPINLTGLDDVERGKEINVRVTALQVGQAGREPSLLAERVLS